MYSSCMQRMNPTMCGASYHSFFCVFYARKEIAQLSKIQLVQVLKYFYELFSRLNDPSMTLKIFVNWLSSK